MLKVELVQLYAINKHHECGTKYGDFPYTLHLTMVANIANKYVHQYFTGKDLEDVMKAAWCHDLIEDCRVSYNDLKTHIGEEAADIVYAVTDELGRDREERHKKTYPKIAADRRAIFVKLCDRLANTVFSKYSGSGMFGKYESEFKGFSDALFERGDMDEIWQELNRATFKDIKLCDINEDMLVYTEGWRTW